MIFSYGFQQVSSWAFWPSIVGDIGLGFHLGFRRFRFVALASVSVVRYFIIEWRKHDFRCMRYATCYAEFPAFHHLFRCDTSVIFSSKKTLDLYPSHADLFVLFTRSSFNPISAATLATFRIFRDPSKLARLNGGPATHFNPVNCSSMLSFKLLLKLPLLCCLCRNAASINPFFLHDEKDRPDDFDTKI